MSAPERFVEHSRDSADVAAIVPAELHQALAYSAARAIRDGVGVEFVEGLACFEGPGSHRSIQSGAARRRRVEQRIAEAEARASQARENANAVGVSEDLRGEFLQDAIKLHDAVKKLKAELRRTPDQPDRAAPETFSSDADYVAAALANLALCDELGPAALQESLVSIIDDVRFDIPHSPLSRGDKVTGSFHLRIPARGCVARLGPISFEVTHCSTPTKTSSAAPMSPLAKRVLAERPHLHTSTSSVARHRRAARATRGILVDAGLSDAAAWVLLKCPLTEVADVVCHLAFGLPLQGSYDPAYIERIRDTYLDPSFSWRTAKWAQSVHSRQRIVDAVVAAGGKMLLGDLLDVFGGAAARGRVYPATITRSRGHSLPWKPALLAPAVRSRRRGGCTVSAFACPHDDCAGGWASAVVRVPEVWECLMCPGCLREPVLGAPRLPDSYRLLLPTGGAANEGP